MIEVSITLEREFLDAITDALKWDDEADREEFLGTVRRIVREQVMNDLQATVRGIAIREYRNLAPALEEDIRAKVAEYIASMRYSVQ